MDRRTFLQTASLVPAGALDAMVQQYEGQPAGHLVDGPQRSTRPNVIWILGDQFRAQALACNGDPNSRSPKYRFERAFRRSGHRSRDLAP